MNRKVLTALVAIIVIGAGAAGYFLYLKPVPTPPTPAPAPAPAAPHARIEAPTQVARPEPAMPALPELSASDKFMLDTLAQLVGNKSLMKIFRIDRIIHNIVATVDNLPRNRAPFSVMPVEPVPGQFLVSGPEGQETISPRNAARYAPYVEVATSVDTGKLVAAYVHLYPLFQEAYEKLGYPNGYFNDRLGEALDDMLDAPDLKGPVKLIRPNVFYHYADPDLEDSSAGQKILMRIGSANEAKIKARLRAFKQELALHVRDGKVLRDN